MPGKARHTSSNPGSFRSGSPKGSLVPGEAVVLQRDCAGQIRSFVDSLNRFHTKPHQKVVGGFAVHTCITEVHRITNDLDTVTRNQPSLVEIFAAGPLAAEAGFSLWLGGLKVFPDRTKQQPTIVHQHPAYRATQ